MDAILELGVHNYNTKTDALANFKTTSPRTITVCLDLIEGVCKFWLNDLRQSTKTIKLTDDGPWIPCIKLGEKGKTVTLNPFARDPSVCYELKRSPYAKIDQILLPLL